MNACGCWIKGPCSNEEYSSEHEIEYCPLHACAPELLEELKTERKKLGDLKFNSSVEELRRIKLDSLIARAEGRTK